MRRKTAILAPMVSGAAFMVSGLMGLALEPDRISVGLKVVIIASAIAFVASAAFCVFAAWPDVPASNRPSASAATPARENQAADPDQGQ